MTGGSCFMIDATSYKKQNKQLKCKHVVLVYFTRNESWTQKSGCRVYSFIPKFSTFPTHKLGHLMFSYVFTINKMWILKSLLNIRPIRLLRFIQVWNDKRVKKLLFWGKLCGKIKFICILLHKIYTLLLVENLKNCKKKKKNLLPTFFLFWFCPHCVNSNILKIRNKVFSTSQSLLKLYFDLTLEAVKGIERSRREGQEHGGKETERACAPFQAVSEEPGKRGAVWPAW